jgi:hypothetical protein
LSKRNAIAASLILGIAVLIVEAYFIFLSYGETSEQAAGSSASDTTESELTRPEATTSEATVVEDRLFGNNGAEFTQRASADNIANNSTYIDNPATNGNPDAVLFVTRVSGPGNTSEYAHEIGVWYDARLGGRWAVFNQDLAPMSEGAAFDVAVLQEPNSFVHQANAENTVGNRTFIEDPLVNGDPDAVLSVTQVWNPGGGSGTYNDHPIAVGYDAERDRWAVFNRDRAPMPVGSAFNVAAL